MRRARRFAFWVALLTTVLVVLLRPLAQASPPDPSWISGFYDGADFDDVVHFILTCSGVATAVPALDRHTVRARSALAEIGADHRSADHDWPSPPRAPPASLSSAV